MAAKKKTVRKKAAKKKTVRKKAAKKKPLARKKSVGKGTFRTTGLSAAPPPKTATNAVDGDDIIYSNGSGKPDNGRPPKQARISQIKSLAAIGCTQQEMYAIIGMGKDAWRMMKKNNPGVVEQAIESGRAEGCGSLRRKQHEVAMSGDPKLLIWLGKNRLKQADKALVHQETSVGDTFKKVLSEESGGDGDDEDED